MLSPKLGKNIALCRIDVKYSEIGTEVEIGKLDGHQKKNWCKKLFLFLFMIQQNLELELNEGNKRFIGILGRSSKAFSQFKQLFFSKISITLSHDVISNEFI
jgi:hypothetical protein